MSDEGRGQTTVDRDADEHESRPIRCANCAHEITAESDAVEVDGRHAHTFANPAGYVFEVRCFARAPGIVALGEPDTYFSWFEGAAWQIAICGACHAHLGWAFTGRATFVTLIAERISDA